MFAEFKNLVSFPIPNGTTGTIVLHKTMLALFVVIFALILLLMFLLIIIILMLVLPPTTGALGTY